MEIRFISNRLHKEYCLAFIFCLLMVVLGSQLKGQKVYRCFSTNLYSDNLDSCSYEIINLNPAVTQGTYVDITFHPNGFIYAITSADQLWQIDPDNGVRVLVTTLIGIVGNEQITGLTVNEDGEMIGGGNDNDFSGHLYSLDVSGNLTVLGELPDPCFGDLAYHKGDLYMSAVRKDPNTNILTRNLLYKVDADTPHNSEFLGQVEGDVNNFNIVGLFSMPTSDYCIDNVLIAGATSGAEYFEINLEELNTSPLCSYPNQLLGNAIEFEYLSSKECACVERPCDDDNPCTKDDVELVLMGTEVVCEPCIGELVDCSTPGATEERSCDDGDPNTINDVEVILSCDGSICEPCTGEEVDCNSAELDERECDDGNPCTENDVELIARDTDVVCEPCSGEVVDCSTPGATEERSCDDGDPNTINDVEVILSCDGSICEPCEGEVQTGYREIFSDKNIKFYVYRLTNSSIFLDLTGSIQYFDEFEIYDVNGQLIQKLKINGDSSISINNLPMGKMYILVGLKNGLFVRSKKIF